MPCAFEGCERGVQPGQRGDFCWGHARQRARGQAMRPLRYRGTAWDHVIVALLKYADADAESDVAWTRATNRLRKAVLTYGREKLRDEGLELARLLEKHGLVATRLVTADGRYAGWRVTPKG